MRFYKARCKVWHLGHGNPHYQGKLGDVRMEHSPAEKDLGCRWMAAGMRQHCALAAQKANRILGASKAAQPAGRGGDLPFCSVL